jgi:hypothetical protein
MNVRAALALANVSLLVLEYRHRTYREQERKREPPLLRDQRQFTCFDLL